MLNKLSSVKKHVTRHRTAYAVAATTAVFAAYQYRNAKTLNAFLAEHELLDLYYYEEV